MLGHLHFSQASKLILITPGAENHGCNSGAFTSWYRKVFTLQSVTMQGAVLEDMRAGGAYSPSPRHNTYAHETLNGESYINSTNRLCSADSSWMGNSLHSSRGQTQRVL